MAQRTTRHLRFPTAAQLRVQFGAAFKEARVAAEMSQADFPGHDQGFISRLESGQARLTLGTMVKLAAKVGKALHIHLADPPQG